VLAAALPPQPAWKHGPAIAKADDPMEQLASAATESIAHSRNRSDSPPLNYGATPLQPITHRAIGALGIASLVLGACSLFLTWVPVYGAVGWPLCVIGAVLAVIELARPKRNRAVAGAGLTVCVVSFFAPLFLPLLLGLLARRPLPSGVGTTPLGSFLSVPPSRSMPAPPSALQFSLTSQPFTVNGLSFTVDAAENGVWSWFNVNIKNVTPDQMREVVYWGGYWSESGTVHYNDDEMSAELTDEIGNKYRRELPNNVWSNHIALHPGEGTAEQLSFDHPVSAAKILYLKLSGKNVGETRDVIVSIPVNSVMRAPTPPGFLPPKK
jgi:hypothetical protein